MKFRRFVKQDSHWILVIYLRTHRVKKNHILPYSTCVSYVCNTKISGLKRIKIGLFVVHTVECGRNMLKLCCFFNWWVINKLGINSAACGPLHRNLETVIVEKVME